MRCVAGAASSLAPREGTMRSRRHGGPVVLACYDGARLAGGIFPPRLTCNMEIDPPHRMLNTWWVIRENDC